MRRDLVQARLIEFLCKRFEWFGSKELINCLSWKKSLNETLIATVQDFESHLLQ
jgi:hypothetical protein